MGNRSSWILLILSLLLFNGKSVPTPAWGQAPEPPQRKRLPGVQRLLANRSQPPAIVTRHTQLEIPFTVHRSAMQATEVQLHVSLNQGRTWEIYARQAGPAGKFIFRAPREGSYWFCSRTMDSQQQLWPRGEKKPELIITVDVTKPRIEMIAQPQPSGQVHLAWTVDDANLEPETFQLSGQAEGDPSWEAIATKPLRSDQPTSYRGTTTWQPNTQGPALVIQATVTDQAGNRTVLQRRVLEAPDQAPQLPPRTRPAPAVPPTAPPLKPAPTLPVIPWPADQVKATPGNITRVPGTAPSSRPPAPAPGPLPGNGSPPTQFTTAPRRATVAPELPTIPDKSPFQPFPEVETTLPPVGRPGSPLTLPTGSAVRTCNSRYFQLKYQLPETAKEPGSRQVQLWGTVDGGQTWKHWGNDPDAVTPFEIQVRSDGIFGFRLVITSEQGPPTAQPIRGDAADIWIRVDTRAPRVQLESATLGAGTQSGHLVIRWNAQDLALAQRPITLAYRETEDDAWTTIADQLPNQGNYAWPVGPQVPRSIYLRIDARDQAGNTGTYQHPTSVSLMGRVSRGRIFDVQPLTPPGEPSDP